MLRNLSEFHVVRMERVIVNVAKYNLKSTLDVNYSSLNY